MPGEFDFIHWIRSQYAPRPDVPVGPGDDLAVMRWPSDLLVVGVDQVLDGRHFDSSVHAPDLIGRKAMNRNLSDCAAMAAIPAGAVVTIALPRDASMDFAKSLFLGIKLAGDAFDCPIVGGDTGSWDGRLVVTVTILGKTDGVAPVHRNGARAGDGLFVTGPLGGSILGRHLSFTPRVALARQLATRHPITSMIDLSDGLSRDVRHLCDESGVGVAIDGSLVPIHPDVDRLPPSPLSRLDHALHDGEDYELLFTSSSDIPSHLATRIGTMTSDRTILLDGKPLEAHGWQHAIGSP